MADIISQIKAQALALAKKIGLVKDTGKVAPAAAGGTGGTGGTVKAPKPASPKFDFNLFIKATQDFWEGFFTKKIPAFFQDIAGHFQRYPGWFKGLTQGEQVAHVVVYTGVLTIIVGIVLVVVL